MATRVEALPPPDERLTTWQWARRNLFDGWWNTLLTLLTAAVLLFFASVILRWAARAPWGVGVRVGPRVLFGLWAGIIMGVIWVMSPVRLDQIGGLYLTLLLAVVSIAPLFSIGVLVGMGRVIGSPGSSRSPAGRRRQRGRWASPPCRRCASSSCPRR